MAYNNNAGGFVNHLLGAPVIKNLRWTEFFLSLNYVIVNIMFIGNLYDH